MDKEKVIEFIKELAWQDVKYDAMQSGMYDYASRCAIPRYAKKYFDLWKEMFNEELDYDKFASDNDVVKNLDILVDKLKGEKK